MSQNSTLPLAVTLYVGYLLGDQAGRCWLIPLRRSGSWSPRKPWPGQGTWRLTFRAARQRCDALLRGMLWGWLVAQREVMEHSNLKILHSDNAGLSMESESSVKKIDHGLIWGNKLYARSWTQEYGALLHIDQGLLIISPKFKHYLCRSNQLLRSPFLLTTLNMQHNLTIWLYQFDTIFK